MQILQLKPTQKVVKAYYQELDQLTRLNALSEGAVSPAFAALLRHCAKQFEQTLVEQYSMRAGGRTIRPDGALQDSFNLIHGLWEAKDSQDDLEKEITKKFQAGYPADNILFQAPDRAILWQNGSRVYDADIRSSENLVNVLRAFFEYQPPVYEEWQQAVEAFKDEVPQLAAAVLKLIEQERTTNKKFVQALDSFMQLCRETINPNLSVQAIEEMLIQHLLTERIFRRVFDNLDFVNRNVIAVEIEKVIRALTSRAFSRHEFFKKLDRFYQAIESTAMVIDDFERKQSFLNTVFEKFFQGFSVKVADTHGIVYTPQPIVRFMVNSVEDILQKEFGRSLSDKGVHILDPFVGTGNFLLHVMRKMKKTALRHKYEHELHCNEVMLLPYYIASMNIEHEYLSQTGEYLPFEGICFVDTFETVEELQTEMFSEANTKRVKRQQQTPIFVVLGNPPYNAGQVSENDNNKNRKYGAMDKRVRETYAKDSQATNKNALSDVYVKAFRWASDRIQKSNNEGIVAFVTNNSFIDGYAFDGMRKHLAQDFDALYILDLGGNVRKNPKLSGTTHNVFGIQVGVSINLLVKKHQSGQEPAKIFYSRTDEFWRKEQKYDLLDSKNCYQNIEWQEILPDKNCTWLTDGMSAAFEGFLPMGTKEAKASKKQNIQVLFKLYSHGNDSGRDSWVYNFHHDEVLKTAKLFADTYNSELDRWQRAGQPSNIDEFVITDDTKIKWTRNAKRDLKRGRHAEFSSAKVRNTLYRPFTRQYLYSGKIFNIEIAQFPRIIPTIETESENQIICVSGISCSRPFQALLTNIIPCRDMLEKMQCFPFYIYDEDGSNRRENLTDWGLAQFQAHYADTSISKWDIFYYVYAVLHHPHYRERYAANLKRDLPRIPFAPDFRAFAEAGQQLAELHVHYEQQPEYRLEMIENDDVPLNWRVEKMKLSKDKTQIVYNDFLTLGKIPPDAFSYRLGNRSALEWLIDQYRIKTDKRSGITNDPNRPDDPDYIVRLIKQIVTVSLETAKLINSLPELENTPPQ